MDWGGGSVPIARCLCSCLVAQTVPENNVDFPWNQSITWDETGQTGAKTTRPKQSCWWPEHFLLWEWRRAVGRPFDDLMGQPEWRPLRRFSSLSGNQLPFWVAKKNLFVL
jgi:hypothetical protein